MKQRKQQLSHNYLLQILQYFPDTGTFVWKEKISSRGCVGKEAGYKSKPDGRFRISIMRTKYLRSRLAWFYVHGVWPKNQIDHRNKIRHDDRIDNLREATNQENGWNKEVYCRKYKLPKNIYVRGKKYQVEIQHQNKRKHLGYFDDLDEAIRVRDEFELIHRKFLYDM